MALEAAVSPNFSTMSGPTNGDYRLRVIDLDHLPPGYGGMFATSDGMGKPVITAPNSPPYFLHQTVCS
jgi:hypothetical protein